MRVRVYKPNPTTSDMSHGTLDAVKVCAWGRCIRPWETGRSYLARVLVLNAVIIISGDDDRTWELQLWCNAL